MPDDRSLIEKLTALADLDSGATDGERDNALRLLAKLHPVPAGGNESPRSLTRDDILATPDRKTPLGTVKGPVVFTMAGGWTLTLDAEDTEVWLTDARKLVGNM